MGSRILASLLAMALIFALPVFSFADGEGVALIDSGSPEVSLMALRSLAVNEGISLTAAEGNSGQFGYNIEPYQGDYIISISEATNRINYIIEFPLLPAGSYSFSADFSLPMRDSTHAYYVWLYDSSSFLEHWGGSNLTHADWTFEISEPTHLSLQATFPLESDISQLTMSNFTSSVLVPVEGVSCGWSVYEAFSETNRRDATEDFTWDFGSQPAGNYVLNIYHYGVAYSCDWHIAYGSSPIGDNSRFIPVANFDGVSTSIISHSGGSLILSGDVTFAHPYGDGFFDGVGDDFFQRDNWSYAVSDVIIIPFESAGLEQFGVFGSIVGFFRDQFASLKSFISSQIQLLAGDEHTQSDVQSAADELNKEVQDLQTLSSDLNTQSSNLQQQFTTDFAIPDELSSNSNNIQLIFSFIFSTFGIYTIFIWLPVVLAVIKKLLRL